MGKLNIDTYPHPSILRIRSAYQQRDHQRVHLSRNNNIAIARLLSMHSHAKAFTLTCKTNILEQADFPFQSSYLLRIKQVQIKKVHVSNSKLFVNVYYRNKKVLSVGSLSFFHGMQLVLAAYVNCASVACTCSSVCEAF